MVTLSLVVRKTFHSFISLFFFYRIWFEFLETTLVTVDASGTEAEALSNMASTIATSLGIPMGTATTVTTTEDGITVAYLTTSDEHGQQYITVSGDAVDGETVALVHSEGMIQESVPQEEVDALEEPKTMDETIMEN